ncbi:MAG: hypothetical protein WBA02_11775 [Jannaschia helgolandensis]|jgi:hypothetical protein|uniref:Uncharacterized protein n=1 Tax=Jannaschia helgolandensis TaxID=188906 RepID=A0A1H7R3A7_9RHOB|nr:hypothetical protein [Jannaschia helgolandensis]SEL54405.1 hypothetical protein SAMN04488526_2912 [Jannaschia helgolandensis]|tara:strand:+ start:968 stop:1102 length:135 start_codon:yes stop_codon:yes gene_type:complete
MSRQTWMDRTIEAARIADVRLPWSRKPAPVPTPAQQPAAIRAKV